MYDELVKELRDSAEWADRLALLMGRAEGDTHAPIMRKAADAIEELSKPKWIPVTELFPVHEYGESPSVLTVDIYGAMRVAYFDGGNWCAPSGEALTTTRVAPITHWQPLPEPPKEE